MVSAKYQNGVMLEKINSLAKELFKFLDTQLN